MKKILLCAALILSAGLSARAQYTTLAGNTMYFQQVDPTASYVIQTFPPLPATGFGIWTHDATFGGTVCAIPGVNFVYSTATETLDVAQPDWNVSSSTAAGFIKNKPTINTLSVSNGVSRSLNSSFVVSSTRNALVHYTVTAAPTLSISGGQTYTVNLQVSPDNTTWTTIGTFTNGNTGTLTIGLALTQTITAQVAGVIPANYYARLNTSGSTATFNTGQEVLL